MEKRPSASAKILRITQRRGKTNGFFLMQSVGNEWYANNPPLGNKYMRIIRPIKYPNSKFLSSRLTKIWITYGLAFWVKKVGTIARVPGTPSNGF